jgi:DNA-binding Lrp family transcriptional regulator
MQDVQLDALDARLLRLLGAEPRIGVLELSRRLAVARGTVQARLDKLIARGAIKGFGPDVSPAAIGFGVMSFVTSRTSRRSWRPTRSPAAATCCAGSWPGPTPTCSG